MNTILVWLLLASTYDGGMQFPLMFKTLEQCQHVQKNIPGRYVQSKCIQAEIIK